MLLGERGYRDNKYDATMDAIKARGQVTTVVTMEAIVHEWKTVLVR